MDMHIDQTWRDNHAPGVDGLVRRDTLKPTRRLDSGYAPIPQQQIALGVHTACRVDEPTVQN
jgi:hypothetical protein